LAALAAHVDGLGVEVDVREVEPHRLVTAQAGRVDELDEGAVAELERLLTREGRQRPLELVDLRRLRQPAGAARRELDVRDAVGAEREADQRRGGGEAARDCGRGEATGAAAAELGGVVGEEAGVHIRERAASPLEPSCEGLQVEAVRAAGRFAEARGGEEALDGRARVHGFLFALARWTPCRAGVKLPPSSRRRVQRRDHPGLLVASGLSGLRLGAGAVGAAGSERASSPPNPIELENARPGDGGWLHGEPTRRAIEGYATEVSVQPGDTVHFHVSTTPAAGY